MEPARLTPAGHVQITTSVGGTLPTGEPLSMMRDLRKVRRSEKFSVSSAEDLALGTASMLVSAPGFSSTAAMSIGLSRSYEFSTRVSTSAARVGMRHQLFRMRPGVYGSIGVGATHYFAPLDIEALNNHVTIHHFQRSEIDIPLHVGISGRTGHVWLGPKLVLANYNADVSACLTSSDGMCTTQGRMRMNGTASYMGGQFGLALGYRRFWFGIELTAMRLTTNANLHMNVSGAKTTLPFSPDGWLFSPAVGIISWW